MRRVSDIGVEPALKTRLSNIHPYPAMVADDLAIQIAKSYVKDGATVLDPFCGTARFLMAATNASKVVGIDVNPLAWLMATAKFASINPDFIAKILKQLSSGRDEHPLEKLNRTFHSSVSWFPPSTFKELGRIVSWINSLKLKRPEVLFLGVALSAVVREVSFARKSGWKLHRMAKEERVRHRICPWDRLEKRLVAFSKSLENTKVAVPDYEFFLGDSTATLNSVSFSRKFKKKFDVVVTSPPYGDSVSTVQYGAASALSLSVVSQLDGLSELFAHGSEIDSSCLGGRKTLRSFSDLKPYWAGGKNNRARASVASFLSDYSANCRALASQIVPGGKAIFVVGRRSAGGFRLKLDAFTSARMKALGFTLLDSSERQLKQKRFPTYFNRFGGSTSRNVRKAGKVSSMRAEIVLVFQKSNARTAS